MPMLKMSFVVLDPFSPNTEAPQSRVSAAKELLAWVLGAVYKRHKKTIEMFDSYPNYMSKLPAQKDSFNCGIYGLYTVMLARNSIEYYWPADMQQFITSNVSLFLEMPYS